MGLLDPPPLTRAKANTFYSSQRIMRPNGPLLSCLGDSLESLGYASTSSSLIAPGGPVILRRGEWLSHRRFQLYGPQQDPGDTMADVLNTQLPALLALNPLPNACAIAIGRNDVGGSFNLTTYLASYESVATQLLAVGVCPIFLTPMPTGAAGSPTATADANLRKLGSGLRTLGAKLGVPVFDQYAPLADETGGIKTAYSNGADTTHLNAAGYHAVAKHLLAQGLDELFPATVRSTIKDTANSYDLMAGAGLFKDASPVGFSVAGTGTSVTYVNSVEADGLAGRWAKVVKTNGSTDSGAFRWTKDSAFTPGKVYRFSGRMLMGGTWNVDSGGLYAQVAIQWRTAGTVTSTDLLVNRWDATDPITFSEAFTAPAGIDGVRMVAFLNGTAVDDQTIYFGEWSAINLTDQGLA